MHVSDAHTHPSAGGQLWRAVETAAHLLPAQGPITVFIHHNTLHAFEDLPFTEGVETAAAVFGCHPYLSETRYHEELTRGRLHFDDVETVLREELGHRSDEPVLPNCTRLELRLAMLQFPLRYGPTPELMWFVAETGALHRIRNDVSDATRRILIAETRRWVMRDLRGGRTVAGEKQNSAAPGALTADLAAIMGRFDEGKIEQWSDEKWETLTLQLLWRIACDRVQRVAAPAPRTRPSIRHRDLLLQATGEDADLLVNDVLTRFSAAFLDQGLAHWPLPHRDLGFYRAFIALYREPLGPPDRWLVQLPQVLKDLADREVKPLDAIRESLDALGVEQHEWQDYLSATSLALRGWAGMLRHVEERSDRAARPIPSGSFVEFLAVRLVLDRVALGRIARDCGIDGPLHLLRNELHQRIGPPAGPSVEQRAFAVFQLAQTMGWSPARLLRLRDKTWSRLVEEIEGFSAVERRRIFHLAYERQFYHQSLDALALYDGTERRRAKVPRFQVVCCLDEREESFRRHLEEVAPDVETFGAPGFFAVPMYYRGVTEAYFRPLCPIVIQPSNWVAEQIIEGRDATHRRRTQARRALGSVRHQFHTASRSLALGALLAATFGLLASVPLVARVLVPRLAARVRSLFGRVVRTPAATRLQLERSQDRSGVENGALGFSLAEMADMSERLLRDIGLTSGFARLVFVLGHGSSSLNNPHKSAYDCGACGGSSGAPNARALAQMLNDPRVRELLAARRIHIPAETVFVGGMHNTCNDVAAYSDLGGAPASHHSDVAAAQRDIDEALDRNAHERCRRFRSAPLNLSLSAARQHVEARSEDLAQTRPELGHATNALCIVGRRARTRGLFLDRRAFLVSYDPTTDDAEAAILTRTLHAVFPVCGGINLEYFFSHVDNTNLGCGTKLPHNIAGLVGVMDGAASDLRTGLPWQMVEIHEPVRLLVVVETTPETLLRIFERQAAIGRLANHGWVKVAALDPNFSVVHVFNRGKFEIYQPQADRLPQANTSVDWYRGWREHLEFARIGK
jgi:uncharacterized protein YbcC (UPF0753/DUF2309 family)